MTWGNIIALLFHAVDANTGLHIGMATRPYNLLRFRLLKYDSIKLVSCQVQIMQYIQLSDNIILILSDILHNMSNLRF